MAIAFHQGQVANPTKSIKIKGDIDNIFNKLYLIPQICEEKRSRTGIGDAVGKYGIIVTKQYTIKSVDEFTKTIVFKCPELFNMGSEAIIHFSEEGNNIKIDIEMRRVMGSYDESIELQQANSHIDALLEYISFICQYGDDNWKNNMIKKWGKSTYDLTPEELEIHTKKLKSQGNTVMVVVLILSILAIVIALS